MQPKFNMAPGDLHIAAAHGSETIHALVLNDTRTRCGRDAENWLDCGTQNVAVFMDSAYSCRRCLTAMAND